MIPAQQVNRGYGGVLCRRKALRWRTITVNGWSVALQNERYNSMPWQEVGEGNSAWFYEYDFFQPKYKYHYKANALALLLNERQLAIVSPPSGQSKEDFETIDSRGTVAVLVAPNAGHDAGLAQWQTRYPDAVLYAPIRALENLRTYGRPFVPLAQLLARNVEFRETPDGREAISIARSGKRPVVYLGELVMNGDSLPVARLRFWLTGRRPGIRINSVYSKNLGSDRQMVAQAVLEALKGEPVVVLAHGAPLVDHHDVANARALVEPLARYPRHIIAIPGRRRS